MIAIVLSVFLAALVWALVLFLHLPFGIAIVATAALVLAWTAALLWGRFRSAKAAGEIEKALQSQAKADAQSARAAGRDRLIWVHAGHREGHVERRRAAEGFGTLPAFPALVAVPPKVL